MYVTHEKLPIESPAFLSILYIAGFIYRWDLGDNPPRPTRIKYFNTVSEKVKKYCSLRTQMSIFYHI